MIFGFNTDVKYKGTVYHIQSEARKQEQLLQTQVFVRGRCIGKKATPYSEEASKPEFSDDKMHDLLKVQHKSVVDAVKKGKVADVLSETYGMNTSGFNVHWTNADSVLQDGEVVMRFQVSLSGLPVQGATLISKVVFADEPPVFAKLVCDEMGSVETRVPARAALDAAAIYVQVVHEEHNATRKYRLRQVG